MSPLSTEHPSVLEFLKNHPQWALSKDPDQIERAYVFKDFVAAFRFMSSAALLAQQMDHHPNWSNVYNKVQVHLSTHDVGGLSHKDFLLASQMEMIYSSHFSHAG
jgi:4a-hydroxytetrahydrobiopterin dehydratase